MLGIALAACGCSESGSRKPTPPDGPARRVILITCDTLRPDHLGCYGYGRPTSPNLDRLAQESVVFENAWSMAPLTGPSLSALLAGRPPDEIGATPTNRELLAAEIETLPEVARAAGFATAAIVSNGVLRRAPKEQGDVGVQQGFELYDDAMNAKEQNRDLLERTAPACADAAIRWIDARGPADDRFFLWVHFQDPHGPYTPPAEQAALFARDHSSEPDLRVNSTNHSGEGGIPKYQFVNGETKAGQYVDRYDAEIRYFDDNLGRFLDALKMRGWLDDSLLLFSADHGEFMGEHDYWFCHGEHLYRELVHVPLLMRPPAALRERVLGTKAAHSAGAARREPGLVSHLDVWPTVLEALGLPPRPNRGTSLLAASVPATRVVPQFLGPLRNPNRFLGVTDGQWRVLLVRQGAPQLFDLAHDPGELHDVAAQHPDLVLSFNARYTELMKLHAGPLLLGTKRILDDATRKGMGALGYTDGEDGEHAVIDERDKNLKPSDH